MGLTLEGPSRACSPRLLTLQTGLGCEGGCLRAAHDAVKPRSATRTAVASGLGGIRALFRSEPASYGSWLDGGQPTTAPCEARAQVSGIQPMCKRTFQITLLWWWWGFFGGIRIGFFNKRKTRVDTRKGEGLC